MPFIALKPVRFDRNYFIGDLVPDEVVDPSRAKDLEAMRLIVRTEGNSAPQDKPNGSEGANTPDGEQEPDGGEGAANAEPVEGEQEPPTKRGRAKG